MVALVLYLLVVGIHSFTYHAADGTAITYHDAWEPYRLDTMTDFLEIPTIWVAVIFLTMLALHLVGSSLLLSFATRHESLPGLVLDAFHTIITPPLHVDWELFYRQTSYNPSVIKSWKR